MKLPFGLTLLRTKTLLSLANVSGSRGWLPFIRETSTGAWQRNEEVSLDTAFSNPTLNACLSLISGDVSKLRPMLVEQDRDRIWTEVDSPAFSPVLRKPNHYQDRVSFFEWWMMSKLTHGNTYALKARDGRGVVRALYILDPYRVTPLVSTDGSVFYELSQDVLAEVPTAVVVPASELIHDVMCPLFHPLCGVSPIYAAGYPALQGLNIRRASDKFFSNGSRPGGVLLVPGDITETQATALKAQWDMAFSGENTGKIAVLSGSMEYKPMAMTAEQSQLVDQLKMSDQDIPRVFLIPLYKLGLGTAPTYSNVGSLNQQYWTDCLQKHVIKLQLKLTEGLELDNVPGRTLAVEMDLDDLMLMDSVSRIDAGVKAITGGMSPNEVRSRFFDVGPVPNGDQPFLQRQNWPLEQLGTDQPTLPAVPAAPSSSTKAYDLGTLPVLVDQKLRELAA